MADTLVSIIESDHIHVDLYPDPPLFFVNGFDQTHGPALAILPSLIRCGNERKKREIEDSAYPAGIGANSILRPRV
jgi:hypothetical protein